MTTIRQALNAARKVLGPTAMVAEEFLLGPGDDDYSVSRTVGVRSGDAHSWSVLGHGFTWEEALNEAARRHQRR